MYCDGGGTGVLGLTFLRGGSCGGEEGGGGISGGALEGGGGINGGVDEAPLDVEVCSKEKNQFVVLAQAKKSDLVGPHG